MAVVKKRNIHSRGKVKMSYSNEKADEMSNCNDTRRTKQEYNHQIST